VPNPPLHIAEAVEAAVTYTTARVDIYESDGTTIWMRDAPLTAGSVSVDQGRSERRAIDLTLENLSGRLDNYPGGFWYDKVIKPYRGINYRGVKRQPRILVVEWSGSAGLVGAIQALGYTNVKIMTSVTTVEQCYGYDIVVFDGGGVTLTKGSLAVACYNAGISVFTSGNDNTSSSVPLIGTTRTQTGYSIAPTGANHPVAAGWTTETLSSDSGTVPTSYRSTAVPIARLSNDASAFTALAEENPNGNGAHWVHIHDFGLTGTQARILINNGVKWLFVRGQDLSWETQVGEFMIDQITTQDFPGTVQITGRDYAKKLLTSKFTQNTTFTSGQSVEGLIRTIALNAGITKFIFPVTGKTIQREFSFDRGAPRWDACNDIATAYGYEIFFDGQGYMRLQEYRDPSTSPTVFTFEAGSSVYTTSAYPEAVMDLRPLAYWRFGESQGSTVLRDSSLRGVDGVYQSPSSLRMGVAGALAETGSGNTAVESLNTNNLFVVQNDPRLALTEYTIEMWYRPGPTPADYAIQPLFKGNPGWTNVPYCIYHFGTANGTQTASMVNKIALFASPNDGWTSIVDGPVVVPGEWVHIVFAVKSNGRGKCYVNGTLYSDSAVGALPSNHGVNALQLSTTTGSNGSVTNKYVYLGLGIGGYTVQTGDYLEYEIRVNDVTDKYFVDLESSTNPLRVPNPSDQNGVTFYDTPPGAVNAWATRRLSLAGLVGSTINNIDLACEGDAASKTRYGYFRNINIKRSNGTIALRGWNIGDPVPTGTVLYSADTSGYLYAMDNSQVNSNIYKGAAYDEMVVYNRQLTDADVAGLYTAARTRSRSKASIGDGNVESYSKTTRDARLYNHIVVVGGSSDTIPVSAEAKNTSASSPTSIDKIGARVYEYSSSFITTQAQALDVANSLLKIHALEEFELSLSTLVLPWLEVGEIVEFRDPDPNPGDPTRFLLSSFSIPLVLGKMNPVGKRVTMVS
jgi:hypothetical protein